MYQGTCIEMGSSEVKQFKSEETIRQGTSGSMRSEGQSGMTRDGYGCIDHNEGRR